MMPALVARSPRLLPGLRKSGWRDKPGHHEHRKCQDNSPRPLSSPPTMRGSSRKCATCSRPMPSRLNRPANSASRSRRSPVKHLRRTHASRHSARWAGPDKDFRSAMNRIQTLLVECGAKTPDRRRAHFIAALCLAWPDRHIEEFEGRVDGVVAWPPRGNLGFGYDPLFQPDGFDRTFGEMSAEEKHGLPPKGQGLSHRARAFIKLAAACLPRS